MVYTVSALSFLKKLDELKLLMVKGGEMSEIESNGTSLNIISYSCF